MFEIVLYGGPKDGQSLTTKKPPNFLDISVITSEDPLSPTFTRVRYRLEKWVVFGYFDWEYRYIFTSGLSKDNNDARRDTCYS